MDATLLGAGGPTDLAVYVVWSSQLGAEERHVESAARLILDARVRHFWDGEQVAGRAFEGYFPGLSVPAWDVWMLFAPGVVWQDDGPPQPSWWEHQLGVLESTYPDRRLDATRFARKARELVGTAPEGAANGFAGAPDVLPTPSRPHQASPDAGGPGG